MSNIFNLRSDINAAPYLDFYKEHVTNEDITGFEGSELAPKIDMGGNFVNGVLVEVKSY